MPNLLDELSVVRFRFSSPSYHTFSYSFGYKKTKLPPAGGYSLVF